MINEIVAATIAKEKLLGTTVDSELKFEKYNGYL